MTTKTKSSTGGRKALLKKLLKKTISGASPLPMDGGLGKSPMGSSGDAITGGGGSNLGTNGIF